MGFGETLRVQHQADHHLLAVGPGVPRITPLSGGIGPHLTLEIGRSQIVQINRIVQVEQGPLPVGQEPFDFLPLRVQTVQLTIQRTLVQPAHLKPVRQRRPGRPAGRGQLGAGMDQPTQDHHLGQLPRPLRQTALGQDLTNPQPAIKVPPHMQWSGHPDLFRSHQLGAHRYQFRSLVFALGPAPLLDALGDGLGLGIGTLKGPLPAQRLLDFAHQRFPLGARSRLQVAEGTDDLLTRPLGSGHGFDQEVVDVLLARTGLFDRPADVHGTLLSNRHSHMSSVNLAMIRHYFRKSAMPGLKTKDLRQ